MTALQRTVSHTIIDDVLEEVRSLRKEMRSMRDLIERVVVPAPVEREWLTVEEAAQLIHRTAQAVRARCRTRKKLGVKVDGSWQIDRAQLFKASE